MEKAVKTKLILEDGTLFEGRAFGHIKECVGEVVFCAATVGYQETITNPAYEGKIVVWTNPLSGNYGFNLDDSETQRVCARAFVTREKCAFPNNWRCEMDMDGFFKQKRLIGVEGVDTRALTKHIRRNGAMKGIIDVRGELSPSQIRQKFEGLNEKRIVSEVTAKEKYVLDGKGVGRVGVLDLGVTKSAVSELCGAFRKITVFPAYVNKSEILSEGVSALFVSDGAGSPFDVPEVVQTVRELINDDKIPVFGVSLGALVINLALGGTVEKMKYGRNGHACPVKDLVTGRLYITAQTRLYGVKKLPDGAVPTFVNINDGAVEGFKCTDKRAAGVLFAPSHNPASISTGFIYDSFADWVR